MTNINEEFDGLFEGPEMMRFGIGNEPETLTDEEVEALLAKSAKALEGLEKIMNDTDTDVDPELINNLLNAAYFKISLNHCSECGEKVVTGFTEHMCATCNTELCETCADDNASEFGCNFGHDIYLEDSEPLNCQACG